jgi:hypothetical protein
VGKTQTDTDGSYLSGVSGISTSDQSLPSKTSSDSQISLNRVDQEPKTQIVTRKESEGSFESFHSANVRGFVIFIRLEFQ